MVGPGVAALNFGFRAERDLPFWGFEAVTSAAKLLCQKTPADGNKFA
jgi:hypothetical protein